MSNDDGRFQKMTQSGSPPDQCELHLRRTDAETLEARNVRGEKLTRGSGQGTHFALVEALPAAVAGCSGIDVDLLTARRAEPIGFDIQVARWGRRSPRIGSDQPDAAAGCGTKCQKTGLAALPPPRVRCRRQVFCRCGPVRWGHGPLA